MSYKHVLITGAGGFIGGHLVHALRCMGITHIRAVDIKPFSEWHQYFNDVENICLDLKKQEHCMLACEDITHVFQLAADMGGMGFIETHKAECMLSVLINTHMLVAAQQKKVEKFLFASSACVYNASKQTSHNVTPLKESDAYPADPEDGYGWEKLFSERMCRHFTEDFSLPTRVVRLHNVYGPHGTWYGGREKAPAAICRKIIEAKALNIPHIDIWGDGQQTRSFMYIDDCIRGLLAVMDSSMQEPVNVGSNRLISINELVDMVENIANKRFLRKYQYNAPKGVNGRNSDNTLFKNHFGWEPSTPLEEGLAHTYAWIQTQYDALQSVQTLEKAV
jgi:GDP-D-mannose 3',5'-epimerase